MVCLDVRVRQHLQQPRRLFVVVVVVVATTTTIAKKMCLDAVAERDRTRRVPAMMGLLSLPLVVVVVVVILG